MTEVLDVSHDNNTGEVTQFLILGDDGQPDTKLASPENMLLYDPLDELPFDGGMNDFLSGEHALQIQEDDPNVVVSQSMDEYSYIISINGSPVETTPEKAGDVLEALYTAIVEDEPDKIVNLHRSVLSDQVRRNLVNMLVHTFEESHRIEIVTNGWLVDGFYLVDWNAKMYDANDDRDEGDYVGSGREAVKKDTTFEFVRLGEGIGDVSEEEVTVDGEAHVLTEREILFLAKVKWLLYRRHYHPDEDFWTYTDQWADVDVETGLPEMDDEPNMDLFNP